jgi:signal transduction histidine kinase
VKVSLDQRNDRIVLIVKDNGRGINREQLAGSQSLGIMGMRERALALGGRMKIFGAPHKGTAVIVSLPTHAPGEG